jgi:hypothetical protein
MRIARVFARKTKACPEDDLAFYAGPGLFPPDVDEVHISVTFSSDLEKAERLADEWKRVAPIKVGGRAMGDRGEEFEPGKYLKPGYTITSRGCPNKCWFCEVWKIDGQSRELEIKPGHNVLDDNLLACSRKHISAVFDMLEKQKERIQFTGGLEAKRLEPWMMSRIRALNPLQIFFAYDTPDDWKPLERAAEMCWKAGWTPMAHRIRAYVLMGYPGDTIQDAGERLKRTAKLGIIPAAMLWMPTIPANKPDARWTELRRKWFRPAITSRIIKTINQVQDHKD